MNEHHRCDPTALQPDSAVSTARVLRFMLAYLEDGDLHGAAGVVVAEVGSCPKCLWALILGLAGFAVALMPDRGTEAIDGLHAALTVYLDRVAQQEND